MQNGHLSDSRPRRPIEATLTPALSAIREMAWLDVERARAYAVILTIAWISLLVLIATKMQGGHDVHGDLFGGDYSSFWAASRLVLAGVPSDAYVPTLHYLAELPAETNGYEAFFYPPPYLILCAPLGLLPFFPSLIVFQSITGAAFVATITGILRTPWGIFAALATPLIVLNIVTGQNAFLTAAILGTGLTLLDSKPRLAGAILGIMVMKPHLAVMVPLALILNRHWSALFCAVAAGAALLVLSYVLFGWDTWSAFLANSRDARDTLEQGDVGFIKMQSAFSMARSFGASTVWAYTIHFAVAAGSLAAVVWAWQINAFAATQRSLIVLATLLTTPFLLHYDLLIVALPLAWMCREWTDRGFPPWSKVMMIAVLLAPIPYMLRGPTSFGPPVLLLFDASLIWYAVRDRVPAAMCEPGEVRAR
jgi:hypothetical protein